MILNLIELRNEFENIKNIRLDIINYFDGLSKKIELLTCIYGKYIKQQENIGTILFGLDSLHFQTFLINFEYDNMKRMHVLIENKLYCEYYKLLKLIINYVRSDIDDLSILKVCENKKKYPVYKDLEQYKIYDFELINKIHDDILLLIELMNKFVTRKEKELEVDENNTINGLNLHIVVNTIDFNITLLKQKIKLYINYLRAFHKYHTSYLTRLSIKIGIMLGQIKKDIKLERNSTPDIELKQNIKRFPSLTNLQQEELTSFIETENIIIKNEFNDILTNISDDSEDEREKIDEKQQISDNYCDDINEIICEDEIIEANTNLDDIEPINKTNINILFIDNNKDVTNMEVSNNVDSDNKDIGELTSTELEERWKMNLNHNQMSLEDKDALDKQDDGSSEEDLYVGVNEQDELNKWREIINNPNMSPEEKSKEKTKLKRSRYKMNKKNKHK
jgi:hypothetical protein